MPLVEYGDEYDSLAAAPAIDFTIPAAEQKAVDDPTVLATLGAAFRRENIIGSTLADETFGLNRLDREEGFNPLDEIKGTPLEARAMDAAGIFNRPYFDAWKAQIAREDEDRKTIDAAGWLGTGASAVAGILDLPTLIPGGAVIRGAKGAYSVARSAASVAVAGGIGAAASEVGLQATQQTRTAAESAVGIGGGIIFGGLLGAGAGALMSRLEQRAAVQSIDGLRDVLRTNTSLTPVADDVEQIARSSVGAAAREDLTLDDLTVAGKATKRYADSIAGLNPLLRSLASPSAAQRRIMTGMMENSVYLKMNAEGRGSAAVETIQKQWDRGALGSAIEDFRKVYTEAREAGVDLQPDEFNRQVSFAMRRGDQAADPWVQKAATVWRQRVFDPLKKEAIDVGLLPADVEVSTAESYLMRMWNPRLIEAKEGEFRQIAAQDVREQVEKAVQKLTEVKDRRLQRLNTELADLEAPADLRTSLLESLPQDLTALRQQNPRFEAIETDLAKLRRQFTDARGNDAQRSTLKQQIDTITANAGKDYADYVTNRNIIQSRLSRLRNNIVGRGDQIATLQGRIADVESANVERLRRLHRSLTIIDEDVAKSSPDVWAEKLSAARTQFAEVLDRSNKAQDRLAKVRSSSDGVDGIERVETAETRFEAAEAKRLADMARYAGRIGDFEEIDPAEAVAELRGLVEKRLTDAASIVQRETERMVQLARRMADADPEKVIDRAKQVRARAANVERDYLDRVEIGLDRQNNYEAYVGEIVDGIYNTLTKRSVSDIPRDIVQAARGPLKERTWNIRDDKVEQFLENDIEMIGRRYARTMSADVEMTRRYGSATLTDQLLEVQQEYQGLRQRVIDGPLAPDLKERRLREITKREKSDLADMKAVRDLLRGNYRPEDNSTNFARIARAAGTFNYLRSMGGVLVSSLTDVVRPAMVHGMTAYMRDGIAPLIRNLDAVRLSAKDAKLAGAISERILQSRMATLAELTDPYSASSPFERFLDNTANKFSTLTGMNHWNDFQKTLSSVMTQNRVLKNVERGMPALKDRERSYMGYLCLDEAMTGRIAKQFNEHGQTIDNVRVANTEDWSDDVARRAYYAALNKDVDSIIVSKGVGDVPLFANTPLGRAALQFKSFALASNQRVLMRGMQESPARLMGGIAGMTAIGAFIYWLKGVESGRPPSNNPGTWVAEGLDRSGIFAIGFEINNAMEKAGAPGVYSGAAKLGQALSPGADAKKPASRFATRSVVEGFLGPTFGLANDAVSVGSIPLRAMTGEADLTPSDIGTMRRLAPFATLPYWRWLIDGGFGFQYAPVPALKDAVK